MKTRSRPTSTTAFSRCGFRRPRSRSRAGFRSTPARSRSRARWAVETRTKFRISAGAATAASRRRTDRGRALRSWSARDADPLIVRKSPPSWWAFSHLRANFVRMIPRRAAAIVFGICLLGFTPSSGRSQIIPFVPTPPAGEPGSELTVYLLTIGQGDEVWELFGHNAIWIKDRSDGSDITYNWGMFDFAQPNFLGRFLTGITSYWMEGIDLESMLQAYTQRNRSLLAQELNLTPAQRLSLKHALEENARPENKFYRYDYYRDNCSTRLRDMLDRALGGQLQTATTTRITSETYRSHTRRLTQDNIPVYTGITFALGHPADRPISMWEEMFLPVRVANHLRTVRVRSEERRV